EQVAAAQQLGQIGEESIVQGAVGIEMQRPAAAALAGGRLGDEFGRQFVVELRKLQVGVHGHSGWPAGGRAWKASTRILSGACEMHGQRPRPLVMLAFLCVRFLPLLSLMSIKISGAGVLRAVQRCAAGIVLLCGAPAVSPVAAQALQALPPELQQAWRATKLPDASLSLVAQELGGPRLVSVATSTPRNPASVMKMVTTWAALSGLGPDYSWRTAFYARPGATIDAEGTLSGPLYLKAGGDPLLTTHELWSLLRELRLRGVKNISELVVDRGRFGNVSLDPGAFDGAADRPYNASPDAMMVGLGTVRLIFMPDEASRQWVPIVDPPVRGVRVQGRPEWSTARCPGPPAVST